MDDEQDVDPDNREYGEEGGMGKAESGESDANIERKEVTRQEGDDGKVR